MSLKLVAIDGPVGVGKSSVAATLAAALGWAHLDTGAMYRAVAVLALRSATALDDDAACTAVAKGMKFDFQPSAKGQRVIVNGEDLSEAIRAKDATEAVSKVADLKGVRAELSRRTREMGERMPAVAEGRDMGSVVFPDARWKFYLDADVNVRAQRRADQLHAQGKSQPIGELRASVIERDRRDRTRPVGALRVVPDAVIVDTTDLSEGRVVEILKQIVEGSAG